jgi:hypothetical protein
MNTSEHVDQMIENLHDWRGPLMAQARKAILEADPGIVEEWKWMGSPAWSLDGLVAIGDAHKDKVKLVFAHGAALPDPEKLFNGDDKGQRRRSIDLREGESVDGEALAELVRAAIAYNRTHLKKNAGKKKG